MVKQTGDQPKMAGTKIMNSRTRLGQRGFTLIELIVVIAIMGVLAAITVPTVTTHLGKSREQSFTAEEERIRSAVNSFFSAPENERFLGLRTYPLLGNGQTDETTLTIISGTSTVVALTDQGNPFNLGELVGDATSTDTAIWNPVGGTQGVELSGSWVDGGLVGVRLIDAGSPDKWTTVTVTRGGVAHQTDPRWFFIDFDELAAGGQLQDVPDSVALDNKPPGSTADSSKYQGSYIWYVDSRGEVRALYRELPSTSGFVAGVFP